MGNCSSDAKVRLSLSHEKCIYSQGTVEPQSNQPEEKTSVKKKETNENVNKEENDNIHDYKKYLKHIEQGDKTVNNFIEFLEARFVVFVS